MLLFFPLYSLQPAENVPDTTTRPQDQDALKSMLGRLLVEGQARVGNHREKNK